MSAVAPGFARCPMWSSFQPFTLGISSTAWRHLNFPLFFPPFFSLWLLPVHAVRPPALRQTQQREKTPVAAAGVKAQSLPNTQPHQKKARLHR